MTSGKPIDVDELEAKAKAATPGPWEQTYGYGDSGHNNNVIFGREQPNQYVCRIVSGRGNGGEPESHANAAYIAALNPSVALALIARLKAAEHVAAWAEDADRNMHDDCGGCDACASRWVRGRKALEAWRSVGKGEE